MYLLLQIHKFIVDSCCLLFHKVLTLCPKYIINISSLTCWICHLLRKQYNLNILVARLTHNLCCVTSLHNLYTIMLSRPANNIVFNMSKLALSTLITIIKVVSSLILVVGRGIGRLIDLCDDGVINQSSEISRKIDEFFEQYIKFLESFGGIYDLAMTEKGSKFTPFNELVINKLDKSNIKELSDSSVISAAHASLDYIHSDMYLNGSNIHGENPV